MLERHAVEMPSIVDKIMKSALQGGPVCFYHRGLVLIL